VFTGIIQAIGRVRKVTPVHGGVHMTVDAGALPLTDVKIGDSIAIDGACLTVVALAGQELEFDVSRETLSCTARLAAGAAVNLEKALRLADRLGGHLLSGHVDGVGEIVRFEPVGENRLLEVRIAADLQRYIARKGSIAVNGVSLTVNEVDRALARINLIPHTLSETNLSALMAGARVNIEVDLIARYVERMLPQ